MCAPCANRTALGAGELTDTHTRENPPDRLPDRRHLWQHRVVPALDHVNPALRKLRHK